MVFPPFVAKRGGEYYYELHVASVSNNVSTLGYEKFNNDGQALTQVIEHRKLDRSWSDGGTFHLQSRGKLCDVLRAVRWFICSDRMRELIESATDKCQVWPIRLYASKRVDPKKAVGGYYAVNIYEQLACLDPDCVLPPRFNSGLPTWDAGKVYRIVKSKVVNLDIFRIAYRYRELVVSQAFRDKCDRLGITGVEWLRRSSI